MVNITLSIYSTDSILYNLSNMKNRIRELRKQQNLTQKQLAKIAKIGRTTLSDIENQKHTSTVDIAFDIAKALNIDINIVFIHEEE